MKSLVSWWQHLTFSHALIVILVLLIVLFSYLWYLTERRVTLRIDRREIDHLQANGQFASTGRIMQEWQRGERQ